jgi:hypothetical protein
MAVIFPIEREAQRAVLAVAVVFSVLPIVACCLRAYARRIVRRKLDASDWCVFAACVSLFKPKGKCLRPQLIISLGRRRCISRH